MRRSGRSNGTPKKPSITRCPEEPRPSTIRPSEICSSRANSCASVAGLREKTLRIEGRIVARSVCSASSVSQGIADGPHDSPPLVMCSMPRSSAIRTFSSVSRQSSSIGACSPSFIAAPSRA